jgi:hypothetical protein
MASVKFTIGGNEIEVPVLNLRTLELCKDNLIALGPEMNWIEYASHVVTIIGTALATQNTLPVHSVVDLKNSCSVPEMRNLATGFLELMKISGFEMGNEEKVE